MDSTGYRYLDEIATADVAFHAWGAGMAEMFIAAADATLKVMVEEPETVREEEEVVIVLDDATIELLLFAFLQELVWYKDARRLLLRVVKVAIGERLGEFRLEATARGERIDPERHPLALDVKAVTLHRFAVEQTSRGWRCTVVLDV